MSVASNTPVQFLPGIGIRTANVLHELGIYTAGQLQHIPERMLVELFGPSIRAILQYVAHHHSTATQTAAVLSTVHSTASTSVKQVSASQTHQEKQQKKKSLLKRLQLAAQFVSVL